MWTDCRQFFSSCCINIGFLHLVLQICHNQLKRFICRGSAGKKKKKTSTQNTRHFFFSFFLINLADACQLVKRAEIWKCDVWNLLNWSEFSFKRLTWHGELCWLDTESNIAVVFTNAGGIKRQSNYSDLHENNLSPEVEEHKIGSEAMEEQSLYVARTAAYNIY